MVHLGGDWEQVSAWLLLPKYHLQSNKTTLLLRVSGPTATGNKLAESMSSSTNNCTMVLVLNGKNDSSFLLDLFCNGKDGRFSCSDSILGAANGHAGHFATLAVFIDIDLGPCIVLNFIDRSTALAQNPGDRSFGYSKFEDVVTVFLEFISLIERSQRIKSLLKGKNIPQSTPTSHLQHLSCRP